MADRWKKVFSFQFSVFSFLELIGHPVFKVLLITGYCLLFTLSVIGKLTLQLIKSLRQIKLPRITLPISPLKFTLLFRALARNKLRLCFSLFLIVMLSAFYTFILRDLPSPRQLTTRNQVLTTKILARDGTVLIKIFVFDGDGSLGHEIGDRA